MSIRAVLSWAALVALTAAILLHLVGAEETAELAGVLTFGLLALAALLPSQINYQLMLRAPTQNEAAQTTATRSIRGKRTQGR